MKKEKAKKLSEILKAYSEGQTIQILKNNEWVDVVGELYNTMYSFETLRIKPESRLVPFTFEDNLVGKIILTKGYKTMILSQHETGILTVNTSFLIDYDRLLNYYTFEDGSPCGRYVEQ